MTSLPEQLNCVKYSVFCIQIRGETEITEIVCHLNLVQMKKSKAEDLQRLSLQRAGVSADRRKVAEITAIVEQRSFSICCNFVLLVASWSLIHSMI